MVNNLKVSIALTTYNHEDFIAQSLDSILKQQVNFSYEIVIGEDKSKDRTLEIIKNYQTNYPDKVRVLERSANIGYTRNFDDTMQQCHGEYIAIFDGDDLMNVGKLQKQVDFLDNNPDYVMVGHVVEAFDSETGKIVRVIQPKKKKDYYTIEDLIVEGSFFANSSKMFRRSAYPKNGIDKRIKFIADWAVTLDIVDDKKVGILWDKLALYRVHGTSIMQTLKGADDFNDKTIIINSINNKYKNKFSTLFNRQWAYAYLIYGIDELKKQNNISARGLFIKSLKNNFKYSLSVYFYLILSYLPKNISMYLLK
jgi:glycosyltransferase involved in cell wall biosynthesis